MPTEKVKKVKTLRHNEYYNIQNVYDELYEKSANKTNFKNLYDIIISRENILLAYRNIKSNKGSKTGGTNKNTILNIEALETEKVVDYVRGRLANYIPHKVKRKLIPKPNGKMRPLGIPTIEDRLIQQCIKQVLEPICEAKFHKDSYGFRPNRSTHNAIAKCYNYINVANQYYVVDVDIKGFFDNVDHGKLLKQMWAMGIRDKRVLSIVSKMLKAEIEGEGIPTKGTPQGGILSPLLANIVLNELDWWISSQWLNFPAKQKKKGPKNVIITDKDYKNTSNKLVALRQTKLKPCFIVRYADDFKIFTNNYTNARKIQEATNKWLKERLKLETSEEKSGIVNLKNKYTEFLGIKIKANAKYKDGQIKYVVKSHMLDKQKNRIKEEIKKKIYEVKNDNTPSSMYKMNSLIMGVHNYYSIASDINRDFNDIEHSIYTGLRWNWRRISKSKGTFSATYKKHYSKYMHRKQFFVNSIALYPISGIGFVRPTVFNAKICNYTVEGRKIKHDGLTKVDMKTLKHIMENPIIYRSIEYNDNRISLYSAQGGRCAITGLELKVDNMHCHHKNPRSKGGTDKYQNLIYLIDDIHLLIHSNKGTTQKRIIQQYSLTEEMMDKINMLRKIVGNYNITKTKLIA